MFKRSAVAALVLLTGSFAWSSEKVDWVGRLPEDSHIRKECKAHNGLPCEAWNDLIQRARSIASDKIKYPPKQTSCSTLNRALVTRWFNDIMTESTSEIKDNLRSLPRKRRGEERELEAVFEVVTESLLAELSSS